MRNIYNKNPRSIGRFGAFIFLIAASAASSWADESTERLERRIAELEAQVAKMNAKEGDSWLNERRAEEVKSLVREVLSDADTRASLAEGGATAGWNKGFFLASADGNFLLKIGGQLQLRYIFDHRNRNTSTLPGTDDRNDGGFQMRRSKIEFAGYVFDPKLTYKILLAPQRDSGTVELEDVWAAYEIADGLKFQGGRFQDYFSREQLNSSRRMLSVERSLNSTVFAGADGFTEGVALVYKKDNLRLAGTFTDGLNSGLPGGPSGGGGFVNQGNDYLNDSSDAAFTARIDYILAGDWKQYDDFSSWSGDPLSVILGGAIHYELGESGDRQAHATTTATGAYDSFLGWTVDGSVKTGGLSVFASLFGMHIDATDSNTAKGDQDHFGATIQIAFMVIPDKLEPFVRYEWMSVENVNAADTTSHLNLITAGVNYYFHKHDVKFTLDGTYFFDPVTANSVLGNGMTGLGFNNDTATEEGQIAVRAQLQLLF